MKAKFYSTQKGRFINKLFVKLMVIGDGLQVWQAKTWQDRHDPCYAIIEGIAVPLASQSWLERKVEFSELPDELRSKTNLIKAFKSQIDEKLKDDPGAVPIFGEALGFSPEEVAASLASRAEQRKKRAEEREAERVRKKAREEKRKAEIEAEWLAKMNEAFQQGEAVDGSDLVGFARHLGIDVNPRTAGMIFKRVNWVKDGQASIIGKRLPGNSVFQLYSACRKAVESQEKVA